MYNELIHELNTISLETNGLLERIGRLEELLSNKKPSGDLYADFAEYKNQYQDLVDGYKRLNVLDNEWCNIVRQIVSNNSLQYNPVTGIDYNSLESIEKGIETMEAIIPTLKDGSYILEDFSGLSIDFVDQYRNLLNQRHDLLMDSCENDLGKITNGYSMAISQSIEKYRLNGENYKYNIGGAVYELKSKEDIKDLYSIINDYEKSQDMDLDVEVITGVPLSQASPEIQAKFANQLKEKEDTINLQSGAKVKFKKFVNSGKKVIKLIGSKLVATGKETVENLKAYYAHVNVMNEDNLENEFTEIKALPGEVMKIADDEAIISEAVTEPIPIIESIEQVEPVIRQTIVEPVEIKPTIDSQKRALLSKYSDLIMQKVFGSHAGQINNISQEEMEFTVDNYLDNLIAVGEEKYGDNFVEDIMNETTSEPIKWLMDEVAKGEDLKALSEDTKFAIDNMSEQELEEYLSRLTFSDEELAHFNKLVSDYMLVNPNSSEFTASKEALKSMDNLVKPATKYVTIPEEEDVVSQPDYILDSISDQLTQPINSVVTEKVVDTIDRMNETELDSYINNLNLSVDELKAFDYYTKNYKIDYPGVSDYMAKKACIKTIVDQRGINKTREQMDKEAAIDSLYTGKSK